MLFIDDLVRQMIPEYKLCGKISVACITTTNPVYLVFIGNSVYPELVLRVADSDEKIRAHHVIEKLYDVLGDLVPRPITLAQFRTHQFAIQKGLVGLPWFRLAEKYETSLEWEALGDRACHALLCLHEGIKRFPEWITPYSPGPELRKCFHQCLELGIKFSPQVEALVQQMGAQLDHIGSMTSHYQHGDFCLNNLIFGTDNTIAVIDFDDFGMTAMPLHDEFTLALSIYSLAPGPRPNDPKYALSKCVTGTVASHGLDRSLLPAFFLHHLLFRLGEWSQPVRRHRYRAWLLSLTEAFANNPTSFFEG